MADENYAQSSGLDALNARGLSAKREYVRGLEQRADEEAMSLLVECLCDESWYLRELAEEAFLRLGLDHVQVLLPHLEQGLWFTRTSVARICGRLGYRAAAPGLLRICDDQNATVVEAAYDALVEIGRGGGSLAVASALHRLPPDVRGRRLAPIATRDRDLAERVGRMQANDELMAAEDPASMGDDHPLVRASEEGVEWEVLTSPAETPAAPAERGGGESRSRD